MNIELIVTVTLWYSVGKYHSVSAVRCDLKKRTEGFKLITIFSLRLKSWVSTRGGIVCPGFREDWVPYLYTGCFCLWTGLCPLSTFCSQSRIPWFSLKLLRSLREPRTWGPFEQDSTDGSPSIIQFYPIWKETPGFFSREFQVSGTPLSNRFCGLRRSRNCRGFSIFSPKVWDTYKYRTLMVSKLPSGRTQVFFCIHDFFRWNSFVLYKITILVMYFHIM